MRKPGDDGGRSQLLKGVLEMCLLALISQEPRYGYEMTQKLRDRGLDLVSEGSIYPLLSRLSKAGLVETFLEGSSGGPQRKYYRLSREGRRRLTRWRREWETLAAGVDAVLNEETR